ncbi:MAG: hypothetical protein JO047_12515 [Alphaproteobacteria bacterium]|nr:hypothetical protein [Alphaproteobacteria bacterium]
MANQRGDQGETAKPNPGDEALRGTPGTGEDVCPECHGSGRVDARPCRNCGGSGVVVRVIGGA